MAVADAKVHLLVALAVLVGGCATQESVPFADVEKVACGEHCDSGGTTTTTTACVPNPNCQYSWVTDVYEGILVAPIGEPTPTGACGEPGCHKVAVAGLLFPADDAATAYRNLIEFKLGLDPYVVGCDASHSTLLCNLALEPDVINPTAFEPCGWPMPKPPYAPLTQDQLNTIVGWIECGAPEN
jgi:hypothetical protein